MLHLDADEPVAPQAVETLTAAQQQSLKEAVWEALRKDGPFSLDPQAGLKLFGDYGKEQQNGRFGKALRAVSLGAFAFHRSLVLAEHTSHGVWRCKADDCKPAEPHSHDQPKDAFES